jgi:hypothetical protein
VFFRIRAAAWTQRYVERMSGHSDRVCSKPFASRERSFFNSAGRRPLFFDPPETGLDRLQAVVQPHAASGGRPSSVSALRTAAQYPSTIRAASSSRPSTVRSIGRTPRTVFFSSCLACRSAS